MSDDHAYQAISAYGHNLNHTPNIDRIGGEGVIFLKGFVTNSICAPSRAVMLTGMHSHLNGKVDNLQPFDWNQDNVAKRLQRAGYQTALIGKIHLQGQPQGFDYYNILPGQGQYYNPDFIINGRDTQYHGYVTQITTDLALEWLEDKRQHEQPFMLLYHHKAPHRPWMPEPKYFGLFDSVDFTLPANFYDDYQGRPAAALHEMGIDQHLDIVYDLKMLDRSELFQTRYRKYFQSMVDRMDEEQRTQWNAHYDLLIQEFQSQTLSGKELTQWKYNRYMQDYLSTIQSVDDGVGQILEYLDQNNLTENTIVIYTSDQGFYLGEHGWFDKRFMYEESFRTPMLIRYPREIRPGTRIDALVQNIDFAPTFMDFAGIEVPPNIQGQSLRNLLRDTSSQWRQSIYYTYYEYPGEHNVNRHYGIRTDRYKLIHFYYDLDYWEMYDLKSDLNEMNNLYNDPAYVQIQKSLHQALQDLRVHYGDSDAQDQQHLNRFLMDKK